MSKLCEYCGAELSGAEKFCPKCGAPVSVSTEVKTNVSEVEVAQKTAEKTSEKAVKTKESKKGLIGGIIVFLVVVAIIAGCVFAAIKLLGASYKKPLDYFCKALEKGDAKAFMKMLPDCMKDDFEDEVVADGLEEIKEEFQDKFGKNYKVKYKITKKEKMDKDELKEGQEILEEEYGKGKKTKVTAGYTLTVDITIKGKDDEEKLEDVEVVVAKIGGKWCMVQDPLTSMMNVSLNSNTLNLGDLDF